MAEAKPDRPTFTLLIPTLNEIDGMRAIMPRIDRGWVDQILLVDGGSTDGTVEYARSLGLTVVVQRDVNCRYGYYHDAMPTATGDYIITFSPDGNSIPELIPALVAKVREGYDMVIVSRYLGNARSDDDDVVTRFGNWFFTTLINVLFKGNWTDTLVMFRAWRKELGYPLTQMPEFEPNIAIRALRQNWRVTEIPGDEPPRIGGERKLDPFMNGLRVLQTIILERLR